MTDHVPSNAGYQRHLRAGETPCQPCRDEHARNTRRSRKERVLGRRRSTTATRTKAHIRLMMKHGWSTPAMEKALGMHPKTIGRLLRAKRVFTSTEERVLSLNPYDPTASADKRRVPGVGSTRRLQGLSRLGWPMRIVAERTGLAETTLRNMLKAPRDRVMLSTALAVEAVTDDLEHLNPLKNGVSPEVYRNLVTWGKAKGFAPLAAWEDIDNPRRRPQGVAS